MSCDLIFGKAMRPGYPELTATAQRCRNAWCLTLYCKGECMQRAPWRWMARWVVD